MKPEEDRIRRRLRLLRGKQGEPDPYSVEIDSIAPTEELIKIIRSKPCKYCALERKNVQCSFFYVPVAVPGKQNRDFGLVGLCGDHVTPFIRALDQRGRTIYTGSYCAGRAALPVIGPGTRQEVGPAAFRLIKCLECRRRNAGRQADLFFAATEDLDDDPFESGKQVYMAGYCFKHAEELFLEPLKRDRAGDESARKRRGRICKALLREEPGGR